MDTFPQERNQPLENTLSPVERIMKTIRSSRQPGMIILKYIFAICLVLPGIIQIRLILKSFISPFLYQKDFLQEFLITKAAVSGVDPYLPLDALAHRFLGSIPTNVLAHPTPHPPTVVLLVLPLQWLGYEKAAWAWLFFESLCLIYIAWLLLKWSGLKATWFQVLFVFLLMVAWNAFMGDLLYGQLMIPLLALVYTAWLALKADRQWAGGILLGAAIALKLIVWPLLLFFLLKKKWPIVIGAGLTILFANLAAILIMGFDPVYEYYFRIGAIVFQLYRAHAFNFSLWTVGWRLFAGTGSTATLAITAPPLANIPALAPFVSFVLTAGFLIVCFWNALRNQDREISLSILLFASILVSPIAWSDYFIMVTIPLILLARDLIKKRLHARLTVLSLVLFVGLLIPNWQLTKLAARYAVPNPANDGSIFVPFTASLFTAIPIISLLGLLWLTSRIRYERKPERT